MPFQWKTARDTHQLAFARLNSISRRSMQTRYLLLLLLLLIFFSLYTLYTPKTYPKTKPHWKPNYSRNAGYTRMDTSSPGKGDDNRRTEGAGAEGVVIIIMYNSFIVCFFVVWKPRAKTQLQLRTNSFTKRMEIVLLLQRVNRKLPKSLCLCFTQHGGTMERDGCNFCFFSG